MSYVLFFDVTLVFTLIYETAFNKVPAVFERTINTELTKLGPGKGRGQTCPFRLGPANILGRQLRSIPSVGIKVGEFHTLERTSTPVFLDFVVKYVVSMVMGF